MGNGKVDDFHEGRRKDNVMAFTALGGGTSSAPALDTSKIEALFARAMAAYQPGGSFEKTNYADIEAGKQSAIGRSIQGLVSGGMAGSSLTGSIPLIAEKSAAGSRVKVSAEREQALSGLQAQLAMLIANMQETARERQFRGEEAGADRSIQMLLNQPRTATRSPYISEPSFAAPSSNNDFSPVPLPSLFGGGSTGVSSGTTRNYSPSTSFTSAAPKPYQPGVPLPSTVSGRTPTSSFFADLYPALARVSGAGTVW